MAGRTPHEAVTNFLEPLQLALSCVTKGVVTVTGYKPSDEPSAATMNGGLPMWLAGDRRRGLIVQMQYRIVKADPPRGPWKVSTAAYGYELVDEEERRLIAYHWHPAGAGPITWPHLHLPGRSKLGKVHLPTGRVALEEVLRLAITEFDVKWRNPKWDAILGKTQKAFEEWRSWPTPGKPLPS